MVARHSYTLNSVIRGRCGSSHVSQTRILGSFEGYIRAIYSVRPFHHRIMADDTKQLKFVPLWRTILDHPSGSVSPRRYFEAGTSRSNRSASYPVPSPITAEPDRTQDRSELVGRWMGFSEQASSLTIAEYERKLPPPGRTAEGIPKCEQSPKAALAGRTDTQSTVNPFARAERR